METPVSTQWIDQYLGISDIDNPSFEEVRNFMILWNLFESLLFQGSYSNLKAIHKSQSLQLDKQLITDTITYFRNRYIANNATTPYYANLRLRHNDNEPLIKDVLLGKINNESETVLAIIIIIYRYRNNLFHG